MAINVEDITKLRQQTGAGVGDCKEALEQSQGDFTKAIEYLRKKGSKTADKRADKAASEGIIYAYIHSNNKIGTLIELNCETDFVAKNEEFTKLAHELALQITAASPLYVREQDVPEEVLDKEKEMMKEQLKEEGKPEDMWDKIIEGKIAKWYEEVCLYNQKYIKNEDVTIEEFINEKIAALGEKVEVGSFCRKQV